MEELERELIEYFNTLDENKNSIMNQFRRIKRRLKYEMSGWVVCECGKVIGGRNLEAHKKRSTHIRSMDEKGLKNK